MACLTPWLFSGTLSLERYLEFELLDFELGDRFFVVLGTSLIVTFFRISRPPYPWSIMVFFFCYFLDFFETSVLLNPRSFLEFFDFLVSLKLAFLLLDFDLDFDLDPELLRSWLFEFFLPLNICEFDLVLTIIFLTRLLRSATKFL